MFFIEVVSILAAFNISKFKDKDGQVVEPVRKPAENSASKYVIGYVVHGIILTEFVAAPPHSNSHFHLALGYMLNWFAILYEGSWLW